MPFFLRRVALAHWTGKLPVSDEQRAGARGDFTLGEDDSDGLSLFEVAEVAEKDLVVAAIACGRRNLGNVDLLEIADGEVRRFGDVVETPGGYPVARANVLHRSLPWTQALLNDLADRLLERATVATRYNKARVRAAVLALSLDDVDEGICRNWIAGVKAAG